MEKEENYKQLNSQETKSHNSDVLSGDNPPFYCAKDSSPDIQITKLRLINLGIEINQLVRKYDDIVDLEFKLKEKKENE